MVPFPGQYECVLYKFPYFPDIGPGYRDGTVHFEKMEAAFRGVPLHIGDVVRDRLEEYY